MLAVVERGESPPPLLLVVVQTVVGAGEDVFGGIGGHLAVLRGTVLMFSHNVVDA